MQSPYRQLLCQPMLQLAPALPVTAVHALVLESQPATPLSQPQQPQSPSQRPHPLRLNRLLQPPPQLRGASIKTKSLVARPLPELTDSVSPLSARPLRVAPACLYSLPRLWVIGTSAFRWQTVFLLRPVSLMIWLRASATFTGTRPLTSPTRLPVGWCMLTFLSEGFSSYGSFMSRVRGFCVRAGQNRLVIRCIEFLFEQRSSFFVW